MRGMVPGRSWGRESLISSKIRSKLQLQTTVSVLNYFLFGKETDIFY